MTTSAIAQNPAGEQPERAFASLNQGPEPAAASTNSFKMALSEQGVSIGWMGENDSEWAILVTDPAQALTLELYPHNGVNYYRIKGSSRYMSVSNQAYIGFYNYLSASGFQHNGSRLVSDHNGQQLSLYSTDNGYLYCWDAYTVLDVQFENV